jgi:hypothetical protein
VTIDLHHVPAEGVELGADRVGAHDVVGRAVHRHVVLVDEGDDVAEPEVGGGHHRFPDRALVELAVADQRDGAIRARVEAGGERQPDARPRPCPSEPVDVSTPGRWLRHGCMPNLLPARRTWRDLLDVEEAAVGHRDVETRRHHGPC